MQPHNDSGVVDPSAIAVMDSDGAALAAHHDEVTVPPADRLEQMRDAGIRNRISNELSYADVVDEDGEAWRDVISGMRLDDEATEQVGGWGGRAFVTEDMHLFERDEESGFWSYVGEYGQPTEGVSPSGERYFELNDRLHNVDGPAVIHPDGSVEYWINGKPVPAPEGAKTRLDGWLPDVPPPF